MSGLVGTFPHTYDSDPDVHHPQPARCRCGSQYMSAVHPHDPLRRATRGSTTCVCGKPMDWVGHVPGMTLPSLLPAQR